MTNSLVFKITLALFAFIVVVGVAGIAVVGAANAAAPGDALYGVDRGLENLRLNLASSPEAIVRLQLSAARERLSEAESLNNQGEQEHALQALADFNASVTAATEAAGQAAGDEAQAVSDNFDETFDAVQADDDDDEDGEEMDPEDAAYCGGIATDQHPVGASLAERYDVTYEEVMGWFCGGNGFGEVDLAYALSGISGYTVDELFTMRSEGLGWGEIMQVVGVVGNPKNKNRGTLTPTLTFTPGPSPTAGPSPTPGATSTPGATGTPGATDCTGANPHPHATDLAAQFGVSYEEIMGWFCQGYGFGEIKLAYSIAQAKGVPVAEVFAKRASGMGWGEIMKFYDFKNGNGNNGGNNGNKDKDKDKDKDKGKKKK